MPKNYLIGIGGTGARIIESVVHLCAAGYGPEELNIFLIDPDSGNGNLTNTASLITQYRRCREELQPTEGHPIFKTDIRIPPDEKGLVWSIFEDGKVTLASHINYSNMKVKSLSDFVSVLFNNDELTTKLDEGFRGHPSIGSVVMSELPQDRYPFKMLWDDLGDRKANDVRVFLAGSVFGGTGAAGIPTLGAKQVLKYHPAAKIGENKSRILLGGALVLPYFTFDLDNQTTETMFVTANDFPIATKAALQYYHEKEKKDLAFDEIYFIGDSLGQKVGKFGVGAKLQQNFPHYIEIVSALAAFDFYEQERTTEVPEKKLFTACREMPAVDWDSLPVSRTSEKIRTRQAELKKLVTQMTVFAYSYLTFGQKILGMNHKDIKDAWYRQHFDFKERDEREKMKDPREDSNIKKLNDFKGFLHKFLFWVAAMDDDSSKVNFIDRKMLAKKAPEIGEDLLLLDPEQETTKLNIGQLLKNEQTANMDFNAFKASGLNAAQLSDKKVTEAASKFIHLFYEAAGKYSKLNYK